MQVDLCKNKSTYFPISIINPDSVKIKDLEEFTPPGSIIAFYFTSFLIISSSSRSPVSLKPSFS
jgi:hypothetical protein